MAPLRYQVIGELCILSGVITNAGSAWQNSRTVAELPPSCTPKDGQIIFAAANKNSAHQIKIDTNGVVSWVEGDRQSDDLSLDGIAFYTKQSNILSLLN